MATTPPQPDETPRLCLTAGDPDLQTLIVGKVTLVLGGEPVPVELTVPSGPVSEQDLLPVLQGLSSHLAERGAARAEGQGRTISCRAGCGACCRQLVPVAISEARALVELIEAMPEPRRSEVRDRFDDAVASLDAAGILDRLNRMDEPAETLALDYFRAGVPCPFLEAEACSIHPHRPLICREYLVTSPAENCSDPSGDTIERISIDGRPSRALFQGDAPRTWTPLVLALTEGQALPESRNGSAPDILRDIFARL